jgi:hypothetical protein
MRSRQGMISRYEKVKYLKLQKTRKFGTVEKVKRNLRSNTKAQISVQKNETL